MQSVKKVQRVYYLVTSLFWLATALPLALLVLLAQLRGFNLFEIGVVMGLNSLTVVLLEVPTGGLADAIGRKRVALLSYGFLIVAEAIILFSFTFGTFLFGFILYGVGRALTSGALDAWFVDALQAVEPEIELQPEFAKAETFILLFLGLGALGGSLIPDLFPHLPTGPTVVFSALAMPVTFSILVFIILFFAVWFLVVEERTTSDKNIWLEGVRQVPALVKTAVTLTRTNPIVLLLLGVTTASGFILVSLETFWQPFFADLFGGSAGNTIWFGVIMGGNFLVGMLGNLLATPVSKMLGKRYGVVAAIFQGLRGVVLIGLALVTNLPIAVGLFWLVYLNMAAINSPHSTLLNNQIPSEQRSSMLSISSLASYLGGAIGGIVLGALAERFSVSTAWLIAGGITVLSLVLYLRIDKIQAKEGVLIPYDKESGALEAH